MLDLGYDPDQKSTDIRASISFARSLSPTGLIYLKRRKHLQMGPSLNGEARISAMATENSGVLLHLTAKVFTTALAHGTGDSTHQNYHDQAQCYDLLIDDVYKKFPYITDTDVSHVMIKHVYTYFSQSPHHQRHLDKLVSDWGATDLQRKLSNLFDVRFVDSERRALLAFLDDLPALVAALKEELDLEDISAEKEQS